MNLDGSNGLIRPILINPPIKQHTHLRSTAPSSFVRPRLSGAWPTQGLAAKIGTQIDLGRSQRTSKSIDGVHGPWQKSKQKSFMKQRPASRLQQRQHPKKMVLQINPNNGQQKIFMPTRNRSRSMQYAPCLSETPPDALRSIRTRSSNGS
ncbi:hypothetical protein ACLOJK_036975 [Asimina triloba]